MIIVRHRHRRGHTEMDWLDSRHTFSSGNYRIADRWGSEGAVTVHQDAAILAGELSEGERATHEFADGRRGCLHVARGLLRLNDDELREGDSARIEGERAIELDTDHRAEFLLFNLK